MVGRVWVRLLYCCGVLVYLVFVVMVWWCGCFFVVGCIGFYGCV